MKFRGFPVWLKYVPGIAFRTDNGPFKVCYLETLIISGMSNFHYPLYFNLEKYQITNLVSDKLYLRWQCKDLLRRLSIR